MSADFPPTRWRLIDDWHLALFRLVAPNLRQRTFYIAVNKHLEQLVRVETIYFLLKPSDQCLHHERPVCLEASLLQLCRRPIQRCSLVVVNADGDHFIGRSLSRLSFQPSRARGE